MVVQIGIQMDQGCGKVDEFGKPGAEMLARPWQMLGHGRK
jgi:hypothetical protein